MKRFWSCLRWIDDRRDTLRGVISSVIVAVFLGFFTVSATELPPEIMADKYQQQVEQLIEGQDYVSAFNVMNKIVALQKEHNLTLPDAFLFQYAQVALKAGEPQTTLDAVKKYLVTAGKKGWT